MHNLRRSPIFGLLFGFVCLGCSDPYPDRYEVSGKITVKGEAFKHAGSVSFEPLEGQTTRAGISFTDGMFTIPKDQGLKAGNYLVRLTAGDGKTPTVPEEAGGPGGSTNIVSVDLIPEDYGSRSKQQFEVKAGSPNRVEIDLPYLVDPKARKKR